MKRAARPISLVARGVQRYDARPRPTQLNLDRPVDVAFACYGGLRITTAGSDRGSDGHGQRSADRSLRHSARARAAPQHDGPANPPPPGPGRSWARRASPDAAWYAFILQSGPAPWPSPRFETKPSTAFGGGDVAVQDADPLTPGKNSISVGEDPIAIATDRRRLLRSHRERGLVRHVDPRCQQRADLSGQIAIVNRLDVTNAERRGDPREAGSDGVRAAGRHDRRRVSCASDRASRTSRIRAATWSPASMSRPARSSPASSSTPAAFRRSSRRQRSRARPSATAEAIDRRARVPSRSISSSMRAPTACVLAIGADNSNVLTSRARSEIVRCRYSADRGFRSRTRMDASASRRSRSRRVIGMGGTPVMINDDGSQSAASTSSSMRSRTTTRSASPTSWRARASAIPRSIRATSTTCATSTSCRASRSAIRRRRRAAPVARGPGSS